MSGIRKMIPTATYKMKKRNEKIIKYLLHTKITIYYIA